MAILLSRVRLAVVAMVVRMVAKAVVALVTTEEAAGVLVGGGEGEAWVEVELEALEVRLVAEVT